MSASYMIHLQTKPQDQSNWLHNVFALSFLGWDMWPDRKWEIFNDLEPLSDGGHPQRLPSD